jgi:hypothetical protein
MLVGLVERAKNDGHIKWVIPGIVDGHIKDNSDIRFWEDKCLENATPRNNIHLSIG